MKNNTLDQIVRNVLLSKSLPLHWYAEFLTHAANCLRELTIDSLQIINTKSLTLNSYYAADLPCDMIPGGDVAVGIPNSQFLLPVAQRTNITPLVNTNASGQPVPYGPAQGVDSVFNYFGFFSGWSWGWTWNVDSLGENTGRLFGYDSSNTKNGYQIFPERNQIQFTETFTNCHPVLMYISDGQCVDSASQITPLAFNCISDWINWKRSPNADMIQSPQGQTWVASRKVLRGRINQLDIPALKQILQRAYRATIKN